MELTAQESSNSSTDGNGNGGTSKKNLAHVAAMAASAILLLLLSFLGGRSSSSSTIIRSKEAITSPENLEAVPNRLCEIYHDDKTNTPSNIHMIQTSLGEPSKQWSEVACFQHHERKLYERTSQQQSDENDDENDGGYARPSAIINVDFDKVAFPDREPILGFGGAFTEASALNFWSLNDAGRSVAMELLFGRDGLGYR